MKSTPVEAPTMTNHDGNMTLLCAALIDVRKISDVFSTSEEASSPRRKKNETTLNTINI